ncbi:MAG: hypothetical protein ABJB12_00475 [Pseudomonadota bacterium]
MGRITRSALCSVLAGSLLAACTQPPKPLEPKKSPPPASSSALAPSEPARSEPALPVLVASALALEEVPAVQELTLLRRGQDGPFELLEYALPESVAVLGWGSSSEIRVDGQSMPYAFDAPNAERPGVLPNELWVRRLLPAKPQELAGDCYTPALGPSVRGKHYRFHAPAADRKADPKTQALWLEALAHDFEQRHGAFYGFAAAKLRERLPKPKRDARNSYAYQTRSDLAQLIGTTTGRNSVQEALEQNRSLYLDLASGPRKVPMAKLAEPRLTRHPWAAMLTQLGKQAPPEPLANAAPANFYFVRIRDFSTFLDLSAMADSWGTEALDFLDGRIQDRDLRQRYQTQLALEQTELARTFGPSVIEELAIVGSDPYLVEGSDLTLIFKVKSRVLFDAALAKALDTFGTSHPGLETTKFSHEGVDVVVTRSQDGQVRRHRATVDGLELVSNSPGAIRRVISAIHGKTARLSDEPDFKYMLARDAERDSTVLAFAGDRFVASVIGPQQKIKAAERELALAEASRPGYAALLFGFLNGHSPATAKDLVQAKLLSADDLKPGSVAANFEPGGAAEGAHGSTLGMSPLIDTPDVTMVTQSEQAGYASFAQSYESEWSEYVDPFAIRVSRTQAPAGGTTLDAELRVLPLLRSEYREFTNSVGNAHLHPGALTDGFRMLLGVGKDAEIRHLLTSSTRAFTRHELAFDWIGDYAFVGVADRNELAVAARATRDVSPEQPRERNDDEFAALAQAPAYAGIAIRSIAGATIALAAIKGVLDEVGSGALLWNEVQKHRGVSVIGVRSSDPHDVDVRLYYALTPHALLFSLNVPVLAKLIDDSLDGNAPATVEPKSDPRAAQLVVDLKGKQQGALKTVLTWLLTRGLVANTQAAVDQVNAIFRGAPELDNQPEKANDLMRNYFGSVLRTPEGRSYSFGPDGVQDPLRGSAAAPKWPSIPVPGSPVAQVVDRLDSLRSEVSFDDEPNGGHPTDTQTRAVVPLRSLRVHLTLSLRK